MPLKLPFRTRGQEYPPDLWTRCPSCEEMVYNKQLEKNLRVCPNCGHHFRLRADARLANLLDPGSFEERDATLESVDPLGFVDQKPYPERLAAARATTGLRDAAVWGSGSIGGRPVAIVVMDFAFMGGSMGSVVGEKVTRAGEDALAERVPARGRLGVRRGAHAGGHPGAHAAGQDERRHRPPARGGRALRERDDGSHHGRRLRLFRGPRGRQPGRAQRPHRLRRGARGGRHHRRIAATGLPARRVPLRSRLRGPGRAAPGAARSDWCSCWVT